MARYFVEKYPWYTMSPTIHKYFIHGNYFFSNAPNRAINRGSPRSPYKDFKRYREHYARKCSREKNNADILYFFLLTSDPVITSKQKLQKKKCKPFQKNKYIKVTIYSKTSIPYKYFQFAKSEIE